MPKYLYCITKEFRQPIEFNTQGVENSKVHMINHAGFSCVVSDTKLGDKELSKESAMAHEKVLEEIIERSAIIPIAFGHVAKSEDEIKTNLLETNQNKLKDWLNNLEGKIELSLKAFWLDLNSVLKDIAENSDEIKKIKARGKLTRSDAMRAGEIAAKTMGKKREEMEDDIIKHLTELCSEHKKCNLFGEQMITNIAFLINKENLPIFDKKVNEYAEGLGDNIKLKYTGPVPPYNFVDLKINLK